MTLPRGWREVASRSNRPGSWRFEIRPVGQFRPATLRTVPLEGIEGVKLIAGKLRAPGRHGPDSMVPQAVIFSKKDWPEFRSALAWQETHFTPMENPPDELNSRQRAAARDALGRYFGIGAIDALTDEERGLLSSDLRDVAEEEQLDYERAAHLLRKRIGGEKNLASYVAVLVAGRRRKNPGEQLHDRLEATIYLLHNTTGTWIRAHKKLAGRVSDRTRRKLLIHLEGLQEQIHGICASIPSEGAPRENPSRLEDFKRGAELAVGKLVSIETELSGLLTQALELGSRGERIPDWIADRIRGAELEKKSALEAVKQAVGRHGAAIGEFHVSPRGNPPATKREAIERYREIHGAPPRGSETRRIPDFSSLVHIGRAVSVQYVSAGPRGPERKRVHYEHKFGPLAELYTPSSGDALVILGDLKVSREPRGRYGYIRG